MYQRREKMAVFFLTLNLPFSTESQGKLQGTPVDQEKKQNTMNSQSILLLRETRQPCGNWSSKR